MYILQEQQVGRISVIVCYKLSLVLAEPEVDFNSTISRVFTFFGAPKFNIKLTFWDVL